MLLSKKAVESNVLISYTYDEIGNRVSMADESGTRVYTYDANNRLLNIEKNGLAELTYEYDVVGNITAVTDKKTNKTSYSYDKSNRMESVNYVVSSSSKSMVYSYDVNGNRELITYHGGVAEEYSYDKNNKLLQLLNKRSDGSTISSYSYAYYDNGLCKEKNDGFGKTVYSYDNAGRITEVQAPGKTIVYTYDNSGNRASQNETYVSDQTSEHDSIKYRIKTSEYVYSNTNRLVRLVESMKNSQGNEVLKKITSYFYDKNGNHVSEKSEFVKACVYETVESFELEIIDNAGPFSNVTDIVFNSYDGFNRLKKSEIVRNGERAITEYTYNGDDLRTKKVVKRSKNNFASEETNFLYDSQHVILETNGADQLLVRYIRGINYLARIDSANKDSYYLYNNHGDVVQTVSEAGVIENQYDYDIFGNPTLTIETYNCSIRYAGEYYDTDTGLYYLRARYYNPYTGRFISEDSYWGEDADPLSLNLYTYCHNDPINFVDPTGHTDQWQEDLEWGDYDHDGVIDSAEDDDDEDDDDDGQPNWNDPDSDDYMNPNAPGYGTDFGDDDDDRPINNGNSQGAAEAAQQQMIREKTEEFKKAIEDALKLKHYDKVAEILVDINNYNVEKKVKAISAWDIINEAVNRNGGKVLSKNNEYNIMSKLMQIRLNDLGYDGANGKNLVEDGLFGKNTLAAVNVFKEKNKLSNSGQYSGLVGETTWDWLFSGRAKKANVIDPIVENKSKNSSSTSEYPGGTIGLSYLDPNGLSEDNKNNQTISPYGLIKPITAGKEAGYGEETFEKPSIPYHRSDSGLDISAKIGTPCVAAADGKVVYSELGHTSWNRKDPKTGEYIDTPYSVLIKLDNPIAYKDGRKGYYLYYTHLSKLEFNKATSDKKEISVKQGDVIGYSGIANNSPHLHFGIIIERRQKNYPTDYFSMPEVREMLEIDKGESW